MTLKSAFAPHIGKMVKFGRTRAVAKGPRFRLNRYLKMAAQTTSPASCDFTAKAQASVQNVYLNDELGDCVIAGGYHIVGVETGNALGSPFLATKQQLLDDYGKIGGYNGKPDTDNGCNEETALNYWQNHGFADGTKLLGWLTVDAKNKEEVKAAMYLFENLVFGVELPDAWISPFPEKNGFKWGVAGHSVPDNGHCFVGVGYTDDGVLIDSWGLVGTLSWDAIAKYCVSANGGELYVMLTPDQLAKGAAKAPNGINWTDLIADFDSMGGHIPAPVVVPPTPIPSPTPPTPHPVLVTLADARTWVADGFHNQPVVVMTRSQASGIAQNALTSRWPK